MTKTDLHAADKEKVATERREQRLAPPPASWPSMDPRPERWLPTCSVPAKDA